MAFSGFSAFSSKANQTDLANNRRNAWYKDKKTGDAVGSNFLVPKENFAHFLGWDKETAAEKSGEKKVDSERAIEIAVQAQMEELGDRSSQRTTMFRNMYISWHNYADKPGRERDLVKDGGDAVSESMEFRESHVPTGALGSNGSTNNYMQVMKDYQKESREDNYRYLEMQYKFEFASKSVGVVSNLIKVRHEAVKRSMQDIK